MYHSETVLENGGSKVPPEESVRGLKASPGEYDSLRLHERMKDLISTSNKLVRGFLATLREYINPKLHW